MTAKLPTMEDLRRTEVEQEQLRKVCKMKRRLERIETCVIDQARLDSLGIIIGHPLDVDDIKGLWDVSTRFFQPWVPNELLIQAAADWSLKWRGKIVSKYSLAEWQYGEIKAQWFHGCLNDLYEMDQELWEPWK